MVHSIFKMDNKYFPTTFLEEFKYALKHVKTYITNKIPISFHALDESNDSYEENDVD